MQKLIEILKKNLLILPYIILIISILFSYILILKNFQLQKQYAQISHTLKQKSKYDFDSDASITKYVGPDIGFQKMDYQPILEVFSSQYFEGQAKLVSGAGQNLQELAKDFYKNFGKPLRIISSFRSYQYQKNLTDNDPNSVTNGDRAAPGFSEHQTGLAVDLFEASQVERFYQNPTLNSYRNWMQQNGYKYGFTQSYQRGKDYDGYNIEPWHRRYVGVELATELYKKQITFSQYFYLFY